MRWNSMWHRPQPHFACVTFVSFAAWGTKDLWATLAVSGSACGSLRIAPMFQLYEMETLSASSNQPEREFSHFITFLRIQSSIRIYIFFSIFVCNRCSFATFRRGSNRRTFCSIIQQSPELFCHSEKSKSYAKDIFRSTEWMCHISHTFFHSFNYPNWNFTVAAAVIRRI